MKIRLFFNQVSQAIGANIPQQINISPPPNQHSGYTPSGYNYSTTTSASPNYLYSLTTLVIELEQDNKFFRNEIPFYNFSDMVAIEREVENAKRIFTQLLLLDDKVKKF